MIDSLVLPDKWKGSNLESIYVGGSDRRFFRMEKDNKTTILMCDKPESDDFKNYIEIQKLLFDKGIGVPEIYWKDENRGMVIMEDLGDETLQHFFLKNRDVKIYFSVLNCLLDIQIKCNLYKPLFIKRKIIFDRKKLRGESRYFEEYFFGRRVPELEEEFILIAEKVSKIPMGFMHRDFHSQNLFIKDGRIRIVDFQTAHWGPLTYDLASCLVDPYVSIPSGQDIDNFLKYYHNRASKFFNFPKWEDFLIIFNYTAIQRLFQALAAFVYLSEVKQKREFRKYIEPGYRRLLEFLKKTAGEFHRLENTLLHT